MLKEYYPPLKQTLCIILCIGFVFWGYTGSCQNNSCTDSVQSRYYSSPSFLNSQSQSFPSSVHTADDGTVFFFNKASNTGNGNTVDSLLIFKTDREGNILWSKALNETATTYFAVFDHLIEMSNGNLLLSGNITYTGNNTGPVLSGLLLLDGQGSGLWQKTYNLGITTALNEWENGEIALAGWDNNGTTRFLISLLDANGNLIRNNCYFLSSKTDNSVPAGIHVINHQLYIGGSYTDHDAFFIPFIGVWMLSIDYQTGRIHNYRSYRLNHQTPSCDSLSFLGGTGGAFFTIAQNNHLIFSCSIFNPKACQTDSRFFVQSDTSFNILPGGITEFSSLYPTNGLFDEYIEVNKATGNMAYCINYRTNISKSYYGIIGSNNNILRQRELISNDGQSRAIFNLPGYEMVNDGAGIVQNDGYYQFVSTSPDYFDGPDCIGVDTNFLTSHPLIYKDVHFTWTESPGGMVSASDVQLAQQDFVITNAVSCKQISICDSLKIHGPDNFCIDNSVKIFTATKNSLCLRRTDWQIDNSAATVIRKPDDTTIQLLFTKSWQGYLYATSTGCIVRDSIYISSYAPMQKIDLGRDTSLCPGDKLILNAGSGYRNYQWQDGSTDSILPVSQEGFYYLSVTDGCENTSSDTIRVSYITQKVSAGPNLELCKKQDIILAASSGLTDYQWRPADAIDGNPDQETIKISPERTTVYIVTARAQQNCLLTDSVQVTVKNCLNKIIVPTAFSPNQDGKNDLLYPIIFGYTIAYEFSIYNRWGQLVFHSTTPGQGWNGNLNNTGQGVGAFVWLCRYQFPGEREKIDKGSFLLIR